MKNNEQTNGESTPNTPLPTPDPQPATAISAPVYEFPRVQDVSEPVAVRFGDHKEVLRISETETVEIDAFMFTGPRTVGGIYDSSVLRGVKSIGAVMRCVPCNRMVTSQSRVAACAIAALIASVSSGGVRLRLSSVFPGALRRITRRSRSIQLHCRLVSTPEREPVSSPSTTKR